MSLTLYMTAVAPSGGRLVLSGHNAHAPPWEDGPAGPGAGVCGFIVFWLLGGRVCLFCIFLDPHSYSYIVRVGSWSPVQSSHTAVSFFLLTSYVTRSWPLRRSWRWRSPAARGRVQRTGGTYFQSRSEISELRIQRSWKEEGTDGPDMSLTTFDVFQIEIVST